MLKRKSFKIQQMENFSPTKQKMEIFGNEGEMSDNLCSPV